MTPHDDEGGLTQEMSETKADHKGESENQAGCQETVHLCICIVIVVCEKNISCIAKGFQNVWQNLEVLDVAVDFASFYHMETFVQLLAVTNILIIS